MDSIRQAFEDLRGLLDWAPNWAVAIVIVAIAIAVALGVHALLLAIAIRVTRARHPYLCAFLQRTRRLTRTALLVLVLALALPAAPLGAETAATLGHILLLITVALIGWSAMTALHLAGEIYLGRFRLDTPDNLLARKHVTQIRILERTIETLIIIVTIAAALMTFESVRQYGVSLFASAGVAGIVAGLAARPVLSNLFAGIQLAVTQPIRLDDVVVVESEWGTVEEITSTYVVLRLWDLRRLVVPLTYFIEKPFQNWTREQTGILTSVTLCLDFAAPLDRIRSKAKEIVETVPAWDRKVLTVQVTNTHDSWIDVRILAGATSARSAGDLQATLREQIVDFLNREHPQIWPRSRQITLGSDTATPPLLPPSS